MAPHRRQDNVIPSLPEALHAAMRNVWAAGSFSPSYMFAAGDSEYDDEQAFELESNPVKLTVIDRITACAP